MDHTENKFAEACLSARALGRWMGLAYPSGIRGTSDAPRLAKGRRTWYLLCSLTFVSTSTADTMTLFDEDTCWYEREPFMSVTMLLKDVASFGRNLCTVDAVAVLSPFIPLWAGAYQLDDRIHQRHYCWRHHANKKQPSPKLLDMSESLVGITIGVCTACSFAVRNRQLQRTGLLYAVTLPLTWAAKSIIKKFPWNCNLRPPHGDYPRNRCYYGGFPSGHMLEMTYAAVLFGFSAGPHFGIPIAVSTGIIAAAFVQSNRHYVSQLVAGAAIGTVFGCAGYWAVKVAGEQVPLSVSLRSDEEAGGLALCARYDF